jgi:hypothetical protein
MAKSIKWKATIWKQNKSLIITLPKLIADMMNLKEGKKIDVFLSRGKEK